MVIAVAALSGCASGGRAARDANLPSGWPVAGDRAVVSSSFGVRRGGSYHQGIDIAAPRGAAVLATAAGRVSHAGRSGRFGKMVLVDHGGGWQTRYAHLKSIAVGDGKKVKRGQKIGAVGKSGNASGFHLHYEVIRNGTPVDPRPSLNR